MAPLKKQTNGMNKKGIYCLFLMDKYGTEVTGSLTLGNVDVISSNTSINSGIFIGKTAFSRNSSSGKKWYINLLK